MRKALPSIDMGENIANSEVDSCPQCGGAIKYEKDDLATVCGYCGVETYRAQLGWKLKKLTKTANKKASFSLIQAREEAENAVDEVTGTPKVLAFLLILLAILLGLFYMAGAIYDLLPTPIQELIDLIGDVIGAFS